MYTEDNLLPISAVAHYVHCPRRFALLHLEQIWADNIFTAEGTVMHEKADSGENESRGDVKIIRTLRLRSLRLGITGIADVVEFHRRGTSDGGVVIPHISGTWLPFPIEYKRGAAKNIESYCAQLCAQALCLEEMLHVSIPEGALFLGLKQHRTPVVFDASLREVTESACRDIHQLFATGTTPPPSYSKRCESCSIIEQCQPRAISSGKSAHDWLDRQITSMVDNPQ